MTHNFKDFAALSLDPSMSITDMQSRLLILQFWWKFMSDESTMLSNPFIIDLSSPSETRPQLAAYS